MKHRLLALAGILCTAVPAQMRADSTWVYAVQITANIQNSPPSITLNWVQDDYGANSYSVYRKGKEGNSWNFLATLPGSSTSYTDYGVGVGGAYEYGVVKAASLGYTGYGYIYAGIQAGLTEQRGKVVLVVDNSMASPLTSELARLKMDLVGDGWTVVRHDVSRTDSPANIRALIAADYTADPGGVKAAFLFGHIPILRSGGLNVDGHQSRPMPADTYYADVDGWWDNPSYLPSDVELMVGRVDLWNMPGNNAPWAWGSETEMLRNYLKKDHQWRHKVFSVPRRAVLGNRFGDFGGEAFAASGFRNFQPLVGAGKTDIANELDGAPNEQRWSSYLTGGNSYLWAYGCGAGSYASISFMGTHGGSAEIWSTDVVNGDAKAVFFMMMGSWFGEWDSTDDIMRAVLATPSMGLTCSWAGRPHWYYHHMALGEPIGYSAKISMNNGGLYQNQVNSQMRGVHMALMGDPTLRMHPVDPPSNLTAASTDSGIQLNWGASSDSILGYHVYRSSNLGGPYTRISSPIVTGLSYVDSGVSGTYTYMVRAIKLESTPSGTYYNPSQGVFATSDGSGPPPPPPPPPPGADTVPPSVAISAPAANATVSGGSVMLSAAASDNVKVIGVQFRIDGVDYGQEVWVPPFQASWDSTKATSGQHRITAVARDAAGNKALATPVSVNVGTSSGTRIERVWVDDALPLGAKAYKERDRWLWVTGPKISGNYAHQSVLTNAHHQHWFENAEAKLNVGAGDALFCYVYLDPQYPPRQVMLQWSDGSWEHRAYWGQSLNYFGTEGTESRRYMGPMPAAGQWVRLKVPASLVGLEGKALQGMAFTLWGGRATWDRAGKIVTK